MNFRTTLILAVLVVVAAVVVFLLHGEGPPPEDEVGTPVTNTLLEGLEAGDVTRIEIDRTGKDLGKLALERTGDAWRLVEPVEAAADRYQADDLARRLAHLEYGRAVKLNAANVQGFGLAPPRATVRFAAKGASHEIAVGDLGGFGTKQFTYVRLPGGKLAYLVKSTLHDAVTGELAEFRKKEFIDWRGADVARVSLQRDAQTLSAERSDRGWSITRPVLTRGDKETLDDLVRAATALRAQTFVTDDPQADVARFGLDKPRLVVTLEKKPEETGADEAAEKKTEETQEGEQKKEGEENDADGTKESDEPKPVPPESLTVSFGSYEDMAKTRVYARVADRPSVVTVAADKLKDLEKDLAALRDKRAVPLERRRVSYLAIDLAGAAVAVEKAGLSDWQILAPQQAPADADEVTRLIDRLAELKIQEFDDAVDPNEPAHGFKAPHGTVTFRHEGDAKDTTVVVGKDADKGGQVWVMEPGTTTAGRIKTTDPERMKATWLDLHQRNIWKTPEGAEITAVSWARKDETVTLERQGAGDEAVWKMTTPVAEDLDAEKVAKLADRLKQVDAETFLAPADKVAEYGLNEPSITLTVTAEPAGDAAPGEDDQPKEDAGDRPGRTVHTLRIAEAGGKMVALADGGALIFEIAQSLVDQLEEPLSTEPWGKVDTGRVDRLEIAGPDVELTCARSGEAWKVTNLDDFPLNSSKVNMYLDDLAGSKAAKVAAYAAKDPAEYGLDQPEWRIRARGITVDRTFLLSAKGPGAIRYATVEGSGRVVVLESSQVSRLTKDKSHFRTSD